MPYPHCRRVKRITKRVRTEDRPVEDRVTVLTEKKLDNGERIMMRSNPGFKGKPTTVFRGTLRAS